MKTWIEVYVLGYIWQPGIGLCSNEYSIKENIPFARDSIQEWLKKNAGDFQSIEDFAAFLFSDDGYHGTREKEIPWNNLENEIAFFHAKFSDY